MPTKKQGSQPSLFSTEPFIGEVEAHFSSLGETLLVGVDEAGRGPLAGPVVAAAVCLPAGCELEGLDDSKKLTEASREALFDVVMETSIAWSIQSVDHDIIDEINILQATFLGMRRAIIDVMGQLKSNELIPHRVVIDGNKTVPWDDAEGPAQSAVVKGDRRSLNVAAASILAKVHRDRHLVELHQEFPDYGFAQHKGYPTAAHREALRELGPSPVHRRSFRGVLPAEPDVANASVLPIERTR